VVQVVPGVVQVLTGVVITPVVQEPQGRVTTVVEIVVEVLLAAAVALAPLAASVLLVLGKQILLLEVQ
jgi:hypothetical protein